MVTFLGRDGHRLTNLANLKYWGDAFCNYRGDGVQLLGGIYTPHPPRFGTADLNPNLNPNPNPIFNPNDQFDLLPMFRDQDFLSPITSQESILTLRQYVMWSDSE